MESQATLDIDVQELPRIHVVGISGPMESAENIHPIHQRFVETVMSDAPAAMLISGVKSPGGSYVQSGALVYGDYSGPEAKMSAFMQCLFVGSGSSEPSPLPTIPSYQHADVEQVSIEPGRYAVLTHRGDYSELASFTRSVMYQALPSMGLRHSGGPIIEFYRGPGDDGRPVTELAVPVIND